MGDAASGWARGKFAEWAGARERWKAQLRARLSALEVPSELRELNLIAIFGEDAVALVLSGWRAEVNAFTVLEQLAAEAPKVVPPLPRPGDETRFMMTVRALIWARNHNLKLTPVQVALLEVASGSEKGITRPDQYELRKANARNAIKRAIPVVEAGAHPGSAWASLYREK